MISILIRTSNRPIYFAHCMDSIKAQTSNDYRVIVGNDANEFYCHPDVAYPAARSTGRYLHLARGVKTLHFPYNLYLNELMKEVKEGWVMVLDDDDMFACDDAIDMILAKCTDETKAVFWRVNVGGRIVPKDFGRPKVKDISMIGFCFHSKFAPLFRYDEYKQCDYRIADRIYSLLDCVYIDKVLTKTQRLGDGFGMRKDKW